MTISKNHLPIVYNLILLILLYFLVTQCSGNDYQNTVWDKAEKFVKYHSSEEYLIKVDGIFLAIQNKHTPSAWVEYFFSVYSTRNWMSEDDGYAGYVNEPLLPSGIALMPFSRKVGAAVPQLVIKADDSKSVIIIEGYDYPDTGILFTKQWEFPKLD